MLIYSEKKAFDEYVHKLKVAVKEGTWRMYMEEHEYPNVYLASKYIPCYQQKLSLPYYDEICVDSIVSCNTSNVRDRIPSNFERVINAVPYILENTCRPISVIKSHDNRYHIENGKHRFYAHILLGIKMIPVSVREASNKEEKGDMITIKYPFYSDGSGLAYPEKALEMFNKYFKFNESIYTVINKSKEIKHLRETLEENFTVQSREEALESVINQYDELFDAIKILEKRFEEYVPDIRSVEVKKDINPKRTAVKIKSSNDSITELLGVCSAGNDKRSSRILHEIIKKLDYSVDMRFIKDNDEFKLENKRDANNICFDTSLDMELLENQIVANIKLKKKWDENREIEKEFDQLMIYLSNYEPFDVSVTDFDVFRSFIVQLKDRNYYLVGTMPKDKIESIYLFADNAVPFNNMTIEFLGVIHNDNYIYEKLIH